MTNIDFIDGFVDTHTFDNGGKIFKLKISKDNLKDMPEDPDGYIHIEVVSKKDKDWFYLRENQYMKKLIKDGEAQSYETQNNKEEPEQEDLPF